MMRSTNLLTYLLTYSQSFIHFLAMQRNEVWHLLSEYCSICLSVCLSVCRA